MIEKRRREPEPASCSTGASVEQTYTIADLAKEFSITTRTIRFYEGRGLIAPERVGQNRRYSRRDRARLMLILRGRNLGFTVEDVGEYLALYDADPRQISQTKLLLSKVEAAMSELKTKREDLDRSLEDLKDIRDRCEAHIKNASSRSNA